MAIINTKGVAVYISKTTTTPITFGDADLTDISNEKPPLVTATSSDAAVVNGDIAYTTGVASQLDGKLYAVDASTVSGTSGGSFELMGADASMLASPITSFPVDDAVTVIKAADMVRLCLSTMEFGADTVNNIDVGTYCDPSAQIAGLATPGTITLGGYADADDAGLAEIMIAAEDQQPRFFQVVLPGTDNGYIIGEVTLAGFSMSVPLEGAVSWTVSGTQLKKLRWVHP